MVVGKTRGELLAMRSGDVEAGVGELSNESKHAAVLCMDAVKKLAMSL
jgi:hypothetical protein